MQYHREVHYKHSSYPAFSYCLTHTHGPTRTHTLTTGHTKQIEHRLLSEYFSQAKDFKLLPSAVYNAFKLGTYMIVHPQQWRDPYDLRNLPLTKKKFSNIRGCKIIKENGANDILLL